MPNRTKSNSDNHVTVDDVNNPDPNKIKVNVIDYGDCGEVYQLEFNIPIMEDDVLIKLACNHYNLPARHDIVASPNDDDDFLHEITVNYLLHGFVNRNSVIDSFAGQMGRIHAHIFVDMRIFEKIGDQYAWLDPECRRQRSKLVDDYDKTLKTTSK